MMTTTVKALIAHAAPPSAPIQKTCNDKISVIGAGSVGTAIAFALLAKVSFKVVISI